MGHDSHRERFKRLYEAYEREPFPRSAGLELGDAHIDMALEDTYLNGYAATYMTHRELPDETILLNPSIDERIEAVKAENERERKAKEAFQEYRARMRELAALLNSIPHTSSRPR